MLKIASALPDFSVSNVPGRLDARTTTAFFRLREIKTSGWDFSCTATRIPGRSTSPIVEMEEPAGTNRPLGWIALPEGRLPAENGDPSTGVRAPLVGSIA